MFRFTAILFCFFSFISLANANSKPTLTIYSYDSFLSDWGPGQKIKEDFEAICDCNINIIGIGDGVTILNRLRLEGEKTKADVILGLDTNLISIAKQNKLVRSHQIDKTSDLAVNWWDTDFIPYDYGYFAFIYNSEQIQNPPTSLDELINNQENWKIVYQDPRTSTPGLGLLLWMNHVYDENTPQAWQALAERTLTVTKGWSQAYSLFLKSEADFVLSYSTSPVVHIINENDHKYKAVIFDEGHYQQIEVAAITKHTKQDKLAKQFLSFLLTPEVQKQFVEKNIMYPAIKIDLPAAYDEIKPVTKPLSFSSEDVNLNQKIWIKQWQDAVSQ